MGNIETIISRLRAVAGFDEEQNPESGSPVTQVSPYFGTSSVAKRLSQWAGHDIARWKQIRAALLTIYAPTWDHIDGRDVLVAWAAAWLKFHTAEHELALLDKGRNLTSQQRASMAARRADVSFWERLAKRLNEQVRVAIDQDPQAAKALESFVKDKEAL